MAVAAQDVFAYSNSIETRCSGRDAEMGTLALKACALPAFVAAATLLIVQSDGSGAGSAPQHIRAQIIKPDTAAGRA